MRARFRILLLCSLAALRVLAADAAVSVKGRVLDAGSCRGVGDVVVKFSPPKGSGIAVVVTATSGDGTFQADLSATGEYYMAVHDGPQQIYGRVQNINQTRSLLIMLHGAAGTPDPTGCVAADLLHQSHKYATSDDGDVQKLSLNLLLYALSATHAAHLAFTPDETAGLQAILWRNGWVQTFEAQAHHPNINDVDVSPDGRWLATTHDGGTARIWEIASGHVLHVLEAGAGPVEAVAFSHHGSNIVTATHLGTVKLWDVATGNDTGTHFTGFYQTINGVLFSPDDSRVVAVGPTSGAVWNKSTGAHLSSLQPLVFQNTAIEAIAYANRPRPDVSLLAGGLSDGRIMLWDPETGHVVQGLFEFNQPVVEVLFNPAGTQLAAVTDGGHGELIAIPAGQVLAHYDGMNQHVDLTGVIFGGTGNVLLSGVSPQEFKLWDPSSGQEIVVLPGHAAWRAHGAVSSDRKNLVFWNHNVVRLVPIEFEDLITEARRHSTKMSAEECSEFFYAGECPPIDLP